MANVDDIIQKLLNQYASKTHESAKTYSDEPIIRRGSQMPNYQPEPVKQARALETKSTGTRREEARLFVQQARILEFFDDDFSYKGEYSSMSPGYHAMTDRQLRGYLTWRAQVRRGSIPKVCDGFALTYVSELLNGVGTEHGEQAIKDIRAFWERYQELSPSIDRYVKPWLVDYVVWHDLDRDLVAEEAYAAHDHALFVMDTAEKAALEAFPKGARRKPYPFGADATGARELLDALDELSTYHIEQGRLYKEQPDDVAFVTQAVFARLCAYYRTSRTQSMTATLFGSPFLTRHAMFSYAPVWQERPHANTVYCLTDACTYTCNDGSWTVQSYHDGGVHSSRLGQVLRCLDRKLRDALEFAHPLKERSEPKYLTNIVDREIADYLTWRTTSTPEHVEIHIDLSKLEGIRAAAAVTRENLLVDEEREGWTPEAEAGEKDVVATKAESEAPIEPAAVVVTEPTPTSATTAPAPSGNTFGLSPEELAFIVSLLNGKPVDTGKSCDLLVDHINECLFDLVDDTVIEFDENGAPALIEDYVEEVRAALREAGVSH